MFGENMGLDDLAAAGEGAELTLVLARLGQVVGVLLSYPHPLSLAHIHFLITTITTETFINYLITTFHHFQRK